MSTTNTKVAAKLASLLCSTIFVAMSSANAQTWQSLGKAAIPVVVENAACNNSNDTVGISADRKALLTCQSGVWTSTNGIGANCIFSSQGIYTASGKYRGNSLTLPVGSVVTGIRMAQGVLDDVSGNKGPQYPSSTSGGMSTDTSFALYSPQSACPNGDCIDRVIQKCTANGMVIISHERWYATISGRFVILNTKYMDLPY